MPKNLCVVCRKNAPELPDRNRPGSMIKRVCRQCHGHRLLGDLHEIVADHVKRRRAAQPDAKEEPKP